MGDFNEDIGETNSNLHQLLQDANLQLIDIIARNHPHTQHLPTYIRGSTRLDFVLLSSDLIPAVKSCGYLPYHSHFRTDHRFAFVDFDKAELLGTATSKLASHTFREFTSKDPKMVEKYLIEKHKILCDKNFFPRLQHLESLDASSHETDHELAERLDTCWVEAGLAAAKKCKKRRKEWWSVPLHQAIEEKSLLQTHLSSLRTGKDLTASINSRIEKFQLEEVILPITIPETTAALKAVQTRIKSIRATSKSVRDQSMIEQAREATHTGCKSDAEILEIIRKKEAQADRWRKINFAKGGHVQSQMTKVEVPNSWPTTQE
eukprot:scaffold26462_cov166-Cylindrotheca_fusiformis.AAC.1